MVSDVACNYAIAAFRDGLLKLRHLEEPVPATWRSPMGSMAITVGDPHVAMMAPQDDDIELTFFVTFCVFVDILYPHKSEFLLWFLLTLVLVFMANII